MTGPAVLDGKSPARSRGALPVAGIVDCDVHPVQQYGAELHPFLPRRWVEHMESFGGHTRQAMTGQLMFPRMMYAGQRKDAYPARGGPPGSDPALLKSQHLDANGIAHGMLIALSRAGMEERNLDFAATLAHAVNDWQKHHWLAGEPRLHAGIVVPQENVEAAVAEIELRAADPAFKQVIFSPRSVEPLGRRRYWPLYEAAARAGLPVGWHPAGVSGGAPSTPAGWPTYYIQEHYAFSTSLEANLVSLIFEGVFERIPALRLVMIEGGFTWAPALGWRMDRAWRRMRAEVPHLTRPPSETLREHVWFTTQPVDEPDEPAHLRDVIGWIGWDHVMFSSDYPHWDFDDPRSAFRFRMDRRETAMIFRDNATALYGLA